MRDNTNYENIFYYINSLYIEKTICVLIGSLYSKLNWQSIVEAIKVC